MNIYLLSWYKVNAVFKENQQGELNFSVLQAIVKGSYLDIFPELDSPNGIPIFFHVKNRKYNTKLKKTQEFTLEIIVARHTKEDVSKIVSSIKNRMSIEVNQKRYSLISINEPIFRNLDILEDEFKIEVEEDELTLNFLMPYSMVAEKDYPLGWIDINKFLFKFKSRLDAFFKINLEFTNEEHIKKNVTVLPYWNYIQQFTHKSKSQPKTTQFVHGFVGKLYIKGDVYSILPLIILGEELHTGSRLSNAQGYYTIIKNIPHFDTYFPNKEQILNVLQDTIEHYDTQEKEITNKKDFLDDLPKFSEKIQKDILDENFEFSPTETFKLLKKDKTFRLVERFDFEEVVINNYILKLIYEPLNRFISDKSIGYRKGVSREKAIFFIKQNLTDGYNIILESDIEAFFPSINLNKLRDILFKYLPLKDMKLKNILIKSINAKYKKGSTIYDREIGLSQGSSISPLLANLYLNLFDEQIKNENVRLVRYADDFVIMTKSFDKALEVLNKIELILGELNLKIKRNKTQIKSISDGFRFLGYEFKGYNNDTEVSSSSALLKKPLYIVEPYISIAVKHDSLDLIKEQKVFASLPIRRISEIIIMNKALISSALAKKCREFKIPISFTFGIGYDITTMRPDSKVWYTISTKHYNKYNDLKDIEIIEFAKIIVIKKLNNTLKLFEKRDAVLYKELLKKISELIDKIQISTDVNSIRGYEGIAARESFKNYNYFIIDEDFHISKRERFSKEKINSLLNFGYYILFIRINTTIRAMGLNPYLGFLHSQNDRYESLVADIQEFFRAEIDDFIIKVVNMKIIRKEHFFEAEKITKLTYEGREIFINAIEGEFNRMDKYGENLSGRIYLKILNIKNWALNQENLNL
jgi:CRISPR-associated protein Cas1